MRGLNHEIALFFFKEISGLGCTDEDVELNNIQHNVIPFGRHSSTNLIGQRFRKIRLAYQIQVSESQTKIESLT